jgi:molybdopterin-guanine dinucleotide biosynthesis protein
MIDPNETNRGGQLSAPGLLVGITGPCGAGKTTLAEGLKRNGFRARAIAQEHSYVPAMWQMLTKPDLLIFLQASHPVGGARRNMSWTLAEWEEQQRRLAHARSHADLVLDTDAMSIEQVLEAVLAFLKKTG